MSRSDEEHELWADKDFESVPIQQINGPYGIFYPTRQDLHLVIRVQVNLDVHTSVNLGRSGELRLRIGTGAWIPISRSTGELDGSHLATAVYLRKTTDVHTFALLNPNVETGGLTLSCAGEFDKIVDGFCSGEMWAHPILTQQTKSNIEASCTCVPGAGTTTIQVNVEGSTRSETRDGNYSYLSVDTTLGATPNLHASGSGTGTVPPPFGSKRIGFVVHSKPFKSAQGHLA